MNFCINWHSLNPSSFGLRGDIWLDGVPVGGGLLLPNETRGIKMTGYAAGSNAERPYHFGKQQLTDDDDLSSPDDPRLSELNTIRILLDWVYVTEERAQHQPTGPPPNLGPIHEKAAKKAHGDSAGLGAVRPSAARQWYTTQSIGMKKTMLVFHYAPEDWLMAKKIITGPLNLKLRPPPPTIPSRPPNTKRKSEGTVLIGLVRPLWALRPDRRTTSNPSATRKRARYSETPELRIYNGDESDDDEIQEIINPSPKRPKNVKYEQFEPPSGSFVDGEPLTHHVSAVALALVDHDQRKRLVWIESTDGEMYHEYEYKEPKAGYKDYPPLLAGAGSSPNNLKDGVRVSGGLLRDHEVHQTFRMSGCAIESKKRLPFVFGKQQLTDDESSSSNLTNAEDLNTIRLRFEYVTFLEYTTTPPSPPRTRGAIHETIAKTATGDSAGLGDPTPSPQRRWCKTEKVPGLAPVLFIFHYAPYEWLLARGIVSGPNPRSPQKRKAQKSKKAVDHPMTPRIIKIHSKNY
ncbi:hypothetical protein RHS01_06452 [Rhizoctonia solani]|uniref:DUF7918 domain-containing protein n=1 Tax=Rhizoctonia solani TaxID=456999 RepID=A0A8H7IET5_9AGAM|nr:hypothetical protein RHS01_06452 [Rhizoctonia solani]